MSNSFIQGGPTSPFFGNNKAIYLGDEKALKNKRGVELLQTEEEDEILNAVSGISQIQPNVSYNPQANHGFNQPTKNIGFQSPVTANHFTGQSNASFEQFSGQPNIKVSTDKSRTFKRQNQFHALRESKPNLNYHSTPKRQSTPQTMGPTISVINYNNPTINMNFNDNQFNSHQQQQEPPLAYEDQEFYESLNFSKVYQRTNNLKSGMG